MKFNNVLLDFDGVILVNSHIESSKVFSFILSEYGVECSAKEIFRCYLGWRCEDVTNDISKNYGIILPVQEIVQKVRAGYAAKLIKKPLIDESLLTLLGQTKGYICSSNSMEFINKILQVAEMKHFFPDEAIYGREKVSINKPNPEVYLTCIRENNLSVKECVAFEDSAVGVTAAKAAGLFTYGYIKSYPDNTKEEQMQKLRDAGADALTANFNILW